MNIEYALFILKLIAFADILKCYDLFFFTGPTAEMMVVLDVG